MARRDNAPTRNKTNRILKGNKQEHKSPDRIQHEQQWNKAINLLQRRIKALEKQGAIVDFKIPEMPKRITDKAIQAINEIRRRHLIRGVEYKPVGEKKEIKYKPAQQINEQGKYEKWKAPERGKAKEREKEVRERKIRIPEIPPIRIEIPEQKPIDIPEPKPIDIPETEEVDVEKPDTSGYDNDYWNEDDYSYWDEEEYNARREEEEHQLEIADAQIENLKGFIDELGDESVIAKLNNILNNMVAVDGKQAVATNIEANLGRIAEYGILAVKYKGTSKGAGFVNQIAQLIAGDRILSFGELAVLEKSYDFNDDFSSPT